MRDRSVAKLGGWGCGSSREGEEKIGQDPGQFNVLRLGQELGGVGGLKGEEGW